MCDGSSLLSFSATYPAPVTSSPDSSIASLSRTVHSVAGPVGVGAVGDGAVGDVAMVVVSDDAAVLAVADDIGAALPAGAVLVNSSTTSPELAVRLAALVSAERFVELPVMGSPHAVEAGAGRFFAGGSKDTVER